MEVRREADIRREEDRDMDMGREKFIGTPVGEGGSTTESRGPRLPGVRSASR
jgi:hypothetical protein